MIPQEKLDNWIKNKFNVMLIGEAGVGKTAVVLQAFKRNNLRFKYFSCSVLDPWLNFIGCPKEVEEQMPNGEKIKYLDLVRPKEFAFDEVDAIFLDEYNRANKNIKNAVMELIQFKSVHGKVFKNLQMVWTAINPDTKDIDGEMEYDVERLDKAQKGRFHVKYYVPYKCDRDFFQEKFGESGLFAVDWWDELPDDQRKEISPRDLDYALQVHVGGGDIRDSLPNNKCNVGKLIQNLMNGSVTSMVDAIYKARDVKKAKEQINKENFFEGARKKVAADPKLAEFFFPLIENKEKIMTLMADDDYYSKLVKVEGLKDTFIDFMKNNGDKKLAHRLKNDGIGCESVFNSKNFKDLFDNKLANYNNSYLDDKKLKSLKESLAKEYDASVDIWTRNPEAKNLKNQWFQNSQGRKKIYAHSVHLRVDNENNIYQIVNLLMTMLILIDRSHFSTLKEDSFREFFYTLLVDLKNQESKVSPEIWAESLAQLKTFKLNKINQFVDVIIFGNSNGDDGF